MSSNLFPKPGSFAKSTLKIVMSSVLLASYFCKLLPKAWQECHHTW